MILSRLFRRPPATPAAPATYAVPPGVLVHAIGDVHGCLDLLTRLLAAVEADAAAVDHDEHHIVLLGDLIDRGPDSRGVIDLCATRDWGRATPHFLAGNHEELMLSVLDGKFNRVRFWTENGGDATLASYGVPADVIETGTAEQIMAELCDRVPPRHLKFLHAMEESVAIGDYWFVHAGIRPAVPLDRQSPSDLRWIRGDFLDHAEPHPALVVHGHTISDTADIRDNRIGIDTGAYASGRLTALGLHGADRWCLST